MISADLHNRINVAIGDDGSSTELIKIIGDVQTTTKSGALVDAASIAWDVGAIQVATVTLGGNRALATPTNVKDGDTYILIVKQDATGSRTLSYDVIFKWKGGTAPTLSTGANAVDVLTFICHDIGGGLVLYGVEALNFS